MISAANIAMNTPKLNLAMSSRSKLITIDVLLSGVMA